MTRLASLFWHVLGVLLLAPPCPRCGFDRCSCHPQGSPTA